MPHDLDQHTLQQVLGEVRVSREQVRGPHQRLLAALHELVEAVVTIHCDLLSPVPNATHRAKGCRCPPTFTAAGRGHGATGAAHAGDRTAGGPLLPLPARGQVPWSGPIADSDREPALPHLSGYGAVAAVPVDGSRSRATPKWSR